jgi:hypothetical protein
MSGWNWENNTKENRSRRDKDKRQEQQKKRPTNQKWRPVDEVEEIRLRNAKRQLQNSNSRESLYRPPAGNYYSLTPDITYSPGESLLDESGFVFDPLIPSMGGDAAAKKLEAARVVEQKRLEDLRLEAEKTEREAAEKSLADIQVTKELLEDERMKTTRAILSSGDLSSDDDHNNFNYAAYDSSKDAMKEHLFKVGEAADAAYKDEGPVRELWEKTVRVWDDYQGIAHGLMAKEKVLSRSTTTKYPTAGRVSTSRHMDQPARHGRHREMSTNLRAV